MAKREAHRLSAECVGSWAIQIIRKMKSFVLLSTTHRFVMLPLKKARRSQARISAVILCHDLDHACPSEVLYRIKGEAKDWMRRWQRGDLCYVAYSNAEPIAYLWICHGEWRLKDEDEGRALPQRSAFLYDAITRERWRNQGVYQALISRSVDELISRDYESLYLIVNDRDLPARRVPEKVGFQYAEHYIYLYRCLRVLDFRLDRVTFPNSDRAYD